MQRIRVQIKIQVLEILTRVSDSTRDQLLFLSRINDINALTRICVLHLICKNQGVFLERAREWHFEPLVSKSDS